MISKQFKRPAEAGLGIGDDRREPVALGAALGMLDLVGALQRAVDLPGQLRPGVGGIERLVGIHRAGGVGVGRRLPAGQIDGVESGADHLHRLVAGDRAERPNRLVALQQFPQLQRAAAGEAMLDRHRAAQADDVFGAIGPLDAVEAAGRGDYDLVKTCHASVLR